MDFPQILFNNPFRVLDLYAEASLEQITLQGRRLKAAIGASGSYISEKGFDLLPFGFPTTEEKQIKAESSNKSKQAPAQNQSAQQPTSQESPSSEPQPIEQYQRTIEDIDKALALLQNPHRRIMCRLFWFSGASALDRRGVNVLAEKGLIDALDVWKKIYDTALKKPSEQQVSFLRGAYQNASVALMMYGKIPEAITLIESAPFKWVDFDELADDPSEVIVATNFPSNPANPSNPADQTNKLAQNRERIPNNESTPNIHSENTEGTVKATPIINKKSTKDAIIVDPPESPVESKVTFTREQLLQKWYATILKSGNIPEKLGNLGNYSEALQKAAEEVYPLARKQLNQILIGFGSAPNSMAYIVEAITKMMPLIMDLRYLQIIPQRNFFAPYLTTEVIDSFLEEIDPKIFDYVINGPAEIKDTDALTMVKFKDSLLQCAIALDIVSDFVPTPKRVVTGNEGTESKENERTDAIDKAKEEKVEEVQSASKAQAQSKEAKKETPSKSKSKGRNKEEIPTCSPEEALEHLRSIISPYIEILYNLYSDNLSKLIKQPQRVLSTTTQKKLSLEFGAPLLLAKYASVWYEYKFYCDCYPQGRSYQSSLEQFNEGFYKEISKAETVTPWQSYLLLFPQSEHVPEVIEKVTSIRAYLNAQEVDNLQRQKAQTFNSVKVLIAYYTQNPEACTNEEIWSRRALELAKSKSDYRQISHVFGKNRYGKEGSKQYLSILKKEQFKISQAIVLLMLAAFLGLIVFKVAELGMLVLGFGINFNAEIIGVSIAIILFTSLRIYLRRKNRDSGKNATIAFIVSFIIGLFSCVALWNLVPGQIPNDDESDIIHDTIHDYFNSPTEEDGDYQDEQRDKV